MSATSKLSAALLSTLLCTAAAALAPASTAAMGSAGRSPVAHTACAAGSTRGGRRERSHAHHCRSHTPNTHAKQLAKPHPTRAPKPRPASVEPTPAAPATAPEAVGPSTAQASATAHDAAIQAVLSTPCQNTELTPEAANIAQVRTAILCLINRKRAEDNENPLATNPQLEQAAESHCQEMIADDYFAHVSPSGKTPLDRIRETGYIPNPSVGYVIGENLAWGTYQLSTPQAIVAAWIASPGHLANILEGQYRETGIAVTPAVPSSLGDGAPGALYAQEFGVIIQ